MIALAGRRSSVHREGDDLLTAGLGLSGLQASTPPPFASPDQPRADEVRRRAIWSNWNGIADMSAGGGYGQLYGSAAPVPGREFHALATVPGARHPHRVMVQLPDGFDRERRCIVVTASSGSRGVYGAIAVAGEWGLPKGCAVAYTDKGAGTDHFDFDAGVGIRADGTPTGAHDEAVFRPAGAGRGVAFKHAHSGDNPEADWGRHVRQAAEFALRVLDEALPDDAPFAFSNTRVIAVGLSNGGGAVLRAAELDEDWLDAVVAAAPSIHVDAPGARTLYDYATEAALLMPCALRASTDAVEQDARRWAVRCSALRQAGRVEGRGVEAQARSALEVLHARGWTRPALGAAAWSTGLDLWRAIAAAYASAYGRFGHDGHPAGYRYAAAPTGGDARVRAAGWGDGSGLPPGAGVDLIDPGASGDDPALQRLLHLRALAEGRDACALRVQAGIAATRAGLPRAGVPVMAIHGVDDGLIPVAFTSVPYMERARAGGRDVRLWRIERAQHFDALLAWPALTARYVPLLPYIHAALDQIWAALDGRGRMPRDAWIEARPRGADALSAHHLAMPLPEP